MPLYDSPARPAKLYPESSARRFRHAPVHAVSRCVSPSAHPVLRRQKQPQEQPHACPHPPRSMECLYLIPLLLRRLDHPAACWQCMEILLNLSQRAQPYFCKDCLGGAVAAMICSAAGLWLMARTHGYVWQHEWWASLQVIADKAFNPLCCRAVIKGRITGVQLGLASWDCTGCQVSSEYCKA